MGSQPNWFSRQLKFSEKGKSKISAMQEFIQEKSFYGNQQPDMFRYKPGYVPERGNQWLCEGRFRK